MTHSLQSPYGENAILCVSPAVCTAGSKPCVIHEQFKLSPSVLT